MKNLNDPVSVVSDRSNGIMLVTSGRIVGIAFHKMLTKIDFFYNVLSIDGTVYCIAEEDVYDSLDDAIKRAKEIVG